MENLMQSQIEELTPNQYSCFLAYGDEIFCKAVEEEQAYESYLRNYLSFDL